MSSGEYSRSREEFERLLRNHPEIGSLPTDRLQSLGTFYEKVLIENEVQNLTRLLSPLDFFEGHVLDAWELEKSGFLQFPALDLGTGVGSPGLIHTLLAGKPWTLCDSEAQKIGFLNRTITEMDIKGIQTTSSRAEKYLDTHQVGSVVAKAVGTVDKLFGWISNRSTWNTLILLKGPKWDKEWKDFSRSKYRGKLKVQDVREYEVGADSKQRKVILLKRS